MADYFDEMGFTPGELPNQSEHMRRLLRDFALFEDLEIDGLRPPPASTTVTENLPDAKVAQAALQCVFCLKEFEVGETTKVLPCDHQFHSECIITWLKKTSTCPVCRKELPTDDDLYEEFKNYKKREAGKEEDVRNLHNSMFT